MGVPGLFVASTAFVEAAAAQAAALGFAPEAVFVPHPVQDRTDEEMRALADGAMGMIWAKLSAGGSGETGDWGLAIRD